MSDMKKLVIWLCVLALVAATLWPPWTSVFYMDGWHGSAFAGYSFLANPPELYRFGARTSIDFPILCLEYLIILLMCGGLLLTLKTKKA
jgi:hypothetical protein